METSCGAGSGSVGWRPQRGRLGQGRGGHGVAVTGVSGADQGRGAPAGGGQEQDDKIEPHRMTSAEPAAKHPPLCWARAAVGCVRSFGYPRGNHRARGCTERGLQPSCTKSFCRAPCKSCLTRRSRVCRLPLDTWAIHAATIEYRAAQLVVCSRPALNFFPHVCRNVSPTFAGIYLWIVCEFKAPFDLK